MNPRLLPILCAALCASAAASGASAPGWRPIPGGRLAAIAPAPGGRPGFTQIEPGASGVTFSNRLADLSAGLNQVRMNGSGVALGDFDGDGWCDIYLCGLESPNRLYRNLGGWRFEDATEAAGVGCPGQYSTGAAFADVDGDGDLDLLVNGIGTGTRLFLNQGNGRFQESVQPALGRPAGAMSFAIADLDGDGDLDLYVTHYRTNTIRSTGYGMVVDGRGRLQPGYEAQYVVTADRRLLEFGEPDALLLNDGTGRFSEASWTDGRFRDETGRPLEAPPRDWGLSVMIRDLDGDGTPDLYVCNDFFTPDRIWLNDGHGNFRAAPPAMLRHTSNSSMGIDAADLDRDGRDDFLVVDMLSRDPVRRMRQRGGLGQTPNEPLRLDSRPQTERNTLFRNRGDGTYAEIAALAGLQASEWSWGAVFLDVDLDGYEDLLVTTGNLFDMMDDDIGLRLAASPRRPLAERLLAAPRLDTPTLAFRNRGGWDFEETGAAWGFRTTGVSHGMALADLDNDGDLDVVVNRLNAPAGLFRNESPAPRLLVRVRGSGPNTRGIGARLDVSGGPVAQSQVLACGGRYLSSDDAVRTFAAGSAEARLHVEVTWPDGTRSRVENVPANHLLELDPAHSERTAPPPPPDGGKARQVPWFADVSPWIPHRDLPSPAEDFTLQPPIPRRISSLGPGLGWMDLDGDGWEDLVIGGVHPRVFLNREGASFAPRAEEDAAAKEESSVTAVLPWPRPDGTVEILAGRARSAAAGSRAVSMHPAGDFTRSTGEIAAGASQTGPLAMADYDGDGVLDLFVGGRWVPGEYPRPAASTFHRGGPRGLEPDAANTAAVAAAGLVSGAVFTDLDADGDPDLVLACDWGPLRVLRNDGGRFTDVTSSLGLSRYSGWWNGVTSADFDGDGRMDLAASNWGRNSAYQPYAAQGIRAWFGDLSGRGRFEFVEAYRADAGGPWRPWRDRRTLLKGMPWLSERFPSAEGYAAATLDEVLGKPTAAFSMVETRWLDTTVFLNRGDHFDAVPLPMDVQMAPAFGIAAGDFDGDGLADLFVAQNFFAVESGSCRLDAGLGVCLRGDGRGGFRALTAAESGIRIEGEGRAAALADFNHDGRLDLAVTQQGGEARLFRNAAARPGLRVRIEGAPGNPEAVGTRIRANAGPALETHSGSGYWSRDAATAVVTGLPDNARLSVRLPWREAFEVAVPPGAAEIRIRASGSVERVR